MFQQYINQNVPAASRPDKKEGAFLPALPEIAGEKLSRKNPLFSWKRGL